MPAPKNPNTAAATAAVRRRGEETMARKLRERGWTCTPPVKCEDHGWYDCEECMPHHKADYGAPEKERKCPGHGPNAREIYYCDGRCQRPIHTDNTQKSHYGASAQACCSHGYVFGTAYHHCTEAPNTDNTQKSHYGLPDPTGAYADMCSQLPSCRDGEHSESCEVSIYRAEQHKSDYGVIEHRIGDFGPADAVAELNALGEAARAHQCGPECEQQADYGAPLTDGTGITGIMIDVLGGPSESARHKSDHGVSDRETVRNTCPGCGREYVDTEPWPEGAKCLTCTHGRGTPGYVA